MSTTFMPPANLKDFDRSTKHKEALYQAWHERIKRNVASDPGQPAFFDPLNPPVAGTPSEAAPSWTGLPGVVLRLNQDNVLQAGQLVENPIHMGSADPSVPNMQYTPQFYKEHGGGVFPGQQYRSQDEYLEWVSIRDANGIISEVIFTCEGPEYWDTLAQDRDLLNTLYQELLPDNLKSLFQVSDLYFPQNVRWANPNAGGQIQHFKTGDYNPYNKWNIAGAIHLTHPANTLEAEIALARFASLLYGNPTPVTSDPDLICCALYGEVNRNSDPTIGSGVNAQVAAGKYVSLRNPIGLYIKSIDSSQFTMPNGDPIANFNDYFVPIRQSDDGQMIVRARFKVPDGIMSNGKQVRVGNLLANGAQIVTGGQVANAITMQLFALTLPGAPAQQRVACQGRPCPDPNHPEYIDVIAFGQSCPPAHQAALLAEKRIDTKTLATALTQKSSGKHTTFRTHVLS
jgi:hypothetical protein